LPHNFTNHKSFGKEGDPFEDKGVDGKIILRWIFRKWDGGHGLDWSGSGRDMWQYLVNAIMNLRFPQNAGISCLDANRLTSQGGLCFKE